MEAVPVFEPEVPSYRSLRRGVRGILERKVLSNGRFVRELESAVGHRVRAHCVAVSNGTVALELLLRASGLEGSVLLPSFTFAATAHAVHNAGLTPRFVDIDPHTLTLDPIRAEAAVDAATSAIMGVHAFGNPCEVRRLGDLAARHGLTLLFDAAQALGTRLGGKPVGSFGQGEAFSLHTSKIVLAGEGGLVTTRDEALAARLRRTRFFGFAGAFDETAFPDCEEVGTNAKLPEISALIAVESLKGLDRAVEHRRCLAARMRARLGSVPGLTLQVPTADAEPAWFLLALTVEAAAFGMDRDGLSAFLATRGVASRKYFFPAVHEMSCYRSPTTPSLPVTERVARSILCLPIHSTMRTETADAVCDAVVAAHEMAVSRSGAHLGVAPARER